MLNLSEILQPTDMQQSWQETTENPELTEFIRPDGSVDIAGLLKKYPRDEDVPEQVHRRHFVKMTFEQQAAYIAERNRQKAQERRADICKRYHLSHKIDDKSICDIDRYETERQICKNCDGAKCLKPDKGYTPFEEPVLFREENGNVRLTHRECVIRLQHFRQEALNQAFTSSKIPKLYQGKTFDDYKLTKGNAKAVEATKKAIETNKGLFLTGNCGCGKTMLAAIAASESLKRGKSVIFAAVPHLLSDIKATFDSKEKNTLDILKSIETVDLLVLDDLGTEKTTDWTPELLFSIVNARYNDSKQTIITTNYTPEELQMHIAGYDKKWKTTAERILSRICAMCMIAYITGNDWRMA